MIANHYRYLAEFKLVETIHLVMKGGKIYRNEIDGRLSEEAVSFPEQGYSGILRDYMPGDQ